MTESTDYTGSDSADPGSPDTWLIASDADLVGDLGPLANGTIQSAGPDRHHGWLSTLVAEAGDLLNVATARPEVVTLIGVGYAACVACIAAATLVRQGRLVRVGLAPVGRHVECRSDALDSWRRWLTTNAERERDETGSFGSFLGHCPFPDPLDPLDRDLIWSHVGRTHEPLIVDDGRESEWMRGAPGRRITPQGDLVSDHLRSLVTFLA